MADVTTNYRVPPWWELAKPEFRWMKTRGEMVMSQVAIQKVDTRKSSAAEIVDEMNSISERIRRHAYELFEGRSGAAGSEIGDWLAAERDLFRIPESELIDRDGRFEARLSAPGFDPSEIKVAALPDALVCKGINYSQA